MSQEPTVQNSKENGRKKQAEGSAIAFEPRSSARGKAMQSNLGEQAPLPKGPSEILLGVS